jgi:uncharacterized membrane protein YukC
MYFIIGLTILIFVWSVFIYRILVNVRRENEIKKNNEAYYNRKLNSINGQIEKTTGEETETSQTV